MAGDLRFLKGYAYGATSLVIVLSIVAFRQSRNAKFDTIDVQRINIVEADGRLRMTLSGHDKLPDPVIGGKSYPLRSGDGGRGAGVIFMVDSLGTPSLLLLDADGHVPQQLPEAH